MPRVWCGRNGLQAVQIWAVWVFFPVTELLPIDCIPLKFVHRTGWGVESDV